jgi:uncharacterized protein (TIGR03905 family)
MEHLTYTPKGVCSRQMDIDYEDNKIVSVKVTGGCNGNLKGIGSLLVGMDINEAIKRLEGITCGMKPTSCPDQIAQALKTIQK